MKAIKITFISALTKVNAYRLKRKSGVRKGVVYRQYTYIQLSAGYTRFAKRDCGEGVGVDVDGDFAAALSIIYFAIFSQATMKVCFWRQTRRAQRYFRHTYDTLDTNV